MRKILGLAAVTTLLLTGCNPSALVASAVGKAIGAGTGTVSVKVSAAAGTNANSADLTDGGTVFKGDKSSATPPVINLVATSVDVLAGNKTRLLTVTLTGTPTQGATFPVASTSSASTGTAAVVSYSEPAVNSGDKNKIWLATGGTVSVDALAAGSITVSLKGCTMSSTVAGAAAQNADNTATGTFTLDGSLKVDGITGL